MVVVVDQGQVPCLCEEDQVGISGSPGGGQGAGPDCGGQWAKCGGLEGLDGQAAHRPCAGR